MESILACTESERGWFRELMLVEGATQAPGIAKARDRVLFDMAMRRAMD
jgi:hypothetical protein